MFQQAIQQLKSQSDLQQTQLNQVHTICELAKSVIVEIDGCVQGLIQQRLESNHVVLLAEAQSLEII